MATAVVLSGTGCHRIMFLWTPMTASSRARRAIRAWARVLPPLRWLQFLQPETIFYQLWDPPRERGTTWSIVRSCPWRPQYWQV